MGRTLASVFIVALVGLGSIDLVAASMLALFILGILGIMYVVIKFF